MSASRILRRPVRAAIAFWTEPIAAEPLALFRIVLAATVLAGSLHSIAPDLLLYWGPDGVLPANVADGWLERTGRFSLLRGIGTIPGVGDWLPEKWLRTTADWGERTGVVVGAFMLWMAALVSLAIGFRSRTSAAVAWLLTVSFNHRAVWVLNGGDDLALQGLFYLMLAPCGTAWSLDARRRIAGAQRPRIAPWSVRLIQIQVCCIYFFTGISKLRLDHDNDWISGEAIYWAMNDISLVRWSFATLPFPLWLSRILSWGTLAFELGFPLLVLVRRFRPWLLTAGLALHIGIWIAMDVGWFSPNMLCYYAVFLSGPAAERLGTAAGRIVRIRQPRPVMAPGT